MWEFDCPKFRDFNDPLSLEDESPEKYFDVEHSGSDIFEVIEQPCLEDASVVERRITRSMSAEAHCASTVNPTTSKGTDSISCDQHLRAAQAEDEKENLAINISHVPGKHLARSKEKTVKRIISAPNVALKDVKQGSHHNCLQKRSQSTPYKSLAQFVGEYQSKTPVRFRSTCTTRQERPALNALPLRPTVPVTPVLLTKLRSRHKGVNKQDEEKLSKGSKVDLQKAATLHSNQDGSSCAKESSSSSVASNKIKVVATDTKLERRKPRSSSLPRGVSPSFRVSRPRARSTTQAPFSFQQRDEEALRRKQEWVALARKKSEEDVRTFHARPLPNLKKSFRPKKREVQLTVQEPFGLSSNSRHVENLKSTLAKLEQTQKDEQPRRFKAQACSVIHQPPFEPKRSGLRTTPLDVVLHSQSRAEQRRLFDVKLEEAAKRKEAEAAEAERLRKLQEEKEEKEERRRRVHKARPAPQYTKKRS